MKNNLYSVYSNKSERQPKQRALSDLSNGIGMSSYRVNSFDVTEAIKEANVAVEYCRINQEPVFVEFPTYRHREHCGPNFDDELSYRPHEEINYWLSKDPVKLALNHMKKLGKQELIENFESSIQNEINNIFDFAINSPFPNPETLEDGIYANE